MKSLIAFTILILSLSLSAAVSGEDKALKSQLNEMINTEIFESYGEVKSLKCGSYYDGIICSAKLEFIDLGSVRETGDAYTCEETYFFRGGESYETGCSTCWFSKLKPYFRPVCSED